MSDWSVDLPAGWAQADLTAVAEVVRGVSFPKDQKSTVPQEGFLGCLRTTNVQREVRWDDVFFVPGRFMTRQEQLVRLDDILISLANSLELVGKVSLVRAVPFVATIGAFIAIIRVHQGMNSRFVYLQLTSSDTQSYFRRRASTTTNISNISATTILGCPLRIFPLAEQHRIVAKIEELFTRLEAGVEALTKIKAQLKRYRQAVLKHAFEGKLTAEWREAHEHELEPASVLLERIKQERQKTAKGKHKELPPLDASGLPDLPKSWRYVTLDFLASDSRNAIRRGPFGSAIKKAFFVTSGYRVYEQGNVIYDDFERGSYYIDETKFREMRDFEVRPGDVLMSCSGTVGRITIAPEGIRPGVINQALLKITLANRIVDTSYFVHLFRSRVDEIMLANTRGSAMLNVSSVRDLRLIPFPIPSVLEQHVIVDEIERCFSVVDQIEKTVDQGLKQAERLRQSILKRAFEGKLVPQDPDDEPAEILLERIREDRARLQAGAKPQRANRKRATTQEARLI